MSWDHGEMPDRPSLRKALDLKPGSAPALRLAGGQALTVGRWNEAIDLGNKAIERDPLRPNSYNNLGFALLAVERDAEAEAAYRNALELNPDGASRHQAIGLALLLRGKTNAALREMTAGSGRGLAALKMAARISRARPTQSGRT